MQITIRGLTKTYQTDNKTFRALDNINLTIDANTIFTLLGPSGCGKTTLLRSIVGLENPDSGEICIGDEIVFSSEKNIYLPPEKRGLGMVFQTYAIWPHMDVFNNVAYPLQNQNVPKEEIKKRVAETLELVQLSGYENRPATKLSGGQQQRVALARALVAKPKVILFDEPLSNLDAKLREETRKELRSFLTELGITAIYVTHDRIEALALSDTIAVMRSGQIIEKGAPHKIYFSPDSQFVADFIGRANLLEGEILTCNEGYATIKTAIGEVNALNPHGFTQGHNAMVCVRPEFIKLSHTSHEKGVNLFNGTMQHLVFIGEAYEADIKIGETLLTTTIPASQEIKESDAITICFDAQHAFIVAK